MDIRQPSALVGVLALFVASVIPVGSYAKPPHAAAAHVGPPHVVHVLQRPGVSVHHSPATGSLRPFRVQVAPPAPMRLADDPQAPSGARSDHARDAGVVEGQVLSVDYQRGMVALMTPDRGRVDVMVLPSTNIQGRGDGFHTIADIARGSRLRVFLSQRAGQFFAQIIHLR